MNSSITTFTYKGDKTLRTVTINGEAWFVAKDVCDILELSDVSMATRHLDDDEKGTSKVCTPGGMQDMTIISESGVYTLIMRSNKEEAKPFRRWVTHEVLPSIKRTGSYSVPALRDKNQFLDSRPYLSKANFNAQERIIEKAFDAKTDKDFQKVLALDLAFKKRTGFSALNAAGLHIEPNGVGNICKSWNLYRIDWEYHFKLIIDKELTLPEPYTEEHFQDDLIY